MKKEHIKSTVLILLVITNICLGGRILMQKKLWPDGYNFFSNILTFFSDDNDNFTRSHINVPAQIIINTGYQTTRFALNSSNDMFEKVNDIAYKTLYDAFSSASKSAATVPGEEWYAAVMSKSIYLEYSIEYSTELFSRFLGIKESETDSLTPSLSDIVISFDENSNSIVYIRNAGAGTYYRIQTDYPKTELEEVINYFQQNFENKDTDSTIINYSFDLKFDQAFGSQKAVLAPMIPIFSNPQSFAVIRSENPVIRSDGTFDSYIADKIPGIFNINVNTMRKYVESDGSLVFVENNAILTISPDGVIEYTANNPQSGIKLFDSAYSSQYNNIVQSADFIDRIAALTSSGGELFVSSDLTDNLVKASSAELTFDYFAEGLPVCIDYAGKGLKNAVTLKVENGYLTHYTHILREYTVLNETAQTPLYIDALDSAIKNYAADSGQVTINRMYSGYIDDGSTGDKTADWNIEIAG